MLNPDDSPELQGVYVEVPRHSIDELTAILGDFTARNGGVILAEAVDRPNQSAGHLTESYDERYVHVVEDDVLGKSVAAVTMTGLFRYANDNGRVAAYYERILNKLCADPARYGDAMTEYYAHEGTEICGLLADKLPELVSRLKSNRPGSLNLKAIGEGSIRGLNNISLAILKKPDDLT